MRTGLFLSFILLLMPLIAMTYSNSPLVSETCWDIAVHDTFLYELTDWGLMIYDNSNPSAPILLNKLEINLNGDFGSYMKQISNSLLISGSGGSILLDISTPLAPVELHRLAISNINDCDIQNGILIANYVDYSQSEARTFLKTYDMDLFPLLNPISVLDSTSAFELIGSNLYVIDRIHLVGNEPDPQAPVRFSKFSLDINGQLTFCADLDLPWLYQSYASFYPDLQVYEDHIWAYVKGYFHCLSYGGGALLLNASVTCDPDVSTHGGFLSFVVANGAIFSQNGEVFSLGSTRCAENILQPIDPTDAAWLNTMTYQGNCLYMSFVELGYFVFDISNPAAAIQICLHNNWQCFMDVCVEGNALYAVSWTEYEADGSPSGLYIFNVTNPQNPIQTGFYDGNDDYFYSVDVRGLYAYIGGELGLRILNISDPANIQQVATAPNAVAREVLFYDHYIYSLDMIASSANMFKVIDIANPNAPIVHSIFNAYPGQILHAMDFGIYQNYLYILDNNIYIGPQTYAGGLRVYDITNPLQPVFVRTLNPNPDKTLRSLEIRDNYLYISGNHISYMNQYEIWVVNLADPENPVILSSYTSSIPYYDLELEALTHHLFTSDRNIIDLSNPYLLTLIDSTGIAPNRAVGIALSGVYYYEARFNSVNIYYFGDVSSGDEIVPVYPVMICYPNPYNRSGPNAVLTVKFDLPQSGRAQLSLYNIKGQKVNTIFTGIKSSGYHLFQWEPRDDFGNNLASGTYLMRLFLDGEVCATTKLQVYK